MEEFKHGQPTPKAENDCDGMKAVPQDHFGELREHSIQPLAVDDCFDNNEVNFANQISSNATDEMIMSYANSSNTICLPEDVISYKMAETNNTR